jgi:hypothetical protein
MKREQAKDMNCKPKKGKRNSVLDMEIGMEMDAEIDAGVSQQEAVLHMQIVKETAGAPAEDRSASALFVCSMCVSIKPEAVVLLRIYGENGVFLEAITLDPTNRSRNVFQAIVPITLHKPLRGRVAVMPSSAKTSSMGDRHGHPKIKACGGSGARCPSRLQ